MRSRRAFTKEFKLQILQELECRPAAEICRMHNVHPAMLNRWKKEFQSNPKEAFSGQGNLWKEDAKAAKYERIIGQLYAENLLLKKSIEHIQRLKAEERRKRGLTK